MAKNETVADVIVVGGGGAGLAAAAEAARMGRSVILLEKNPQTGGSTSWSVGSVTATNTPHQKRAGIQDSPQAHFEDLALHVYAEHGIDESMSIDRSKHSLFGASKVAADVLAQEYGRYFGLKT